MFTCSYSSQCTRAWSCSCMAFRVLHRISTKMNPLADKKSQILSYLAKHPNSPPPRLYEYKHSTHHAHRHNCTCTAPFTTMQSEDQIYKGIWYMSQETLQNSTNSVEALGRFHKAFMQLTAELQYYFCRACLPFLRNDTYFAVHRFVLTQLTSLSFMECLYCIQKWRTSFTLVATYVHYTLCSLCKPLSAGDSKTMISTYTAVIHYTTVALPSTIHSYIQYHYDDSTLLTTTSRLSFKSSRNTVQRFHGYHFTRFC